MYNNPLNDRKFLKQLDNEQNREIYARITLLTFDEQPIEYIEGKVTGGSLNGDGASALRRTCNLTMVSANLDINIYLLGLERKFKLEIGLKNNINENYPNIIWFKQGLFVTTQVTTTRNASNYSISISGKDKMCLLNGEVAGSLPASIDFGKIEEYSEDGKSIFYKDLLLKDIIRYAVETYGNEISHNIIINDLEECGLELLEYRGDIPMYIFVEEETLNCENITLDQDFIVFLEDTEKEIKVSNNQIIYNSFVDLANTNEVTKIKLEKGSQFVYTIVKLEFGDAIGYRETELVYAGDLIANIGETLTSILDKIKNMLVNFEYFYDIDGRFIFQKKKTYENETLSMEIITAEPDGSNASYYENNKILTELFYNFEGNELVTSFNNNPSLMDIRNDYSIWGVREGISGGEIPIHLRYAIDTKPKKYSCYNSNITYYNKDLYNSGYPEYDWIRINNDIYCDWREIIYQMAIDYNKFRDIDEQFYYKIMSNNLDENGMTLYPGGRTGYEQYYIDMTGFWRNVYSPNGFYNQVLLTEKLYKKGKYYTKSYEDEDKVGRFPIYTINNNTFYDDSLIYYEKIEDDVPNNNDIIDISNINNKKIVACPKCYSKLVTNFPNRLNFWIDFLDTTGDIGRFSVKAIGQRSKNVNDSKITSIYYRRVPNLIFHLEEVIDKLPSYSYIQTNALLENCLSISSQGKSAWDELEVYLNENTYCKENVTINTIPIYYLEPNIRIGVKDEISKVDGEYILTKISVPLTHNGTMSLTATKAVGKVY